MRGRASWLLVFAAAIPMLVVAGLVHDQDVIFPEGAALALGVLALRLPDWNSSPPQLAVLPPTCATIGIALTYAGLPRWAGELAAITAALLLLEAVGSRLTPSLSAAAFPLAFGVHSWAYPLTVLIVCVVLAAVTSMRPSPRGSLVVEPMDRLGAPVMFTAWAVTAGWIAAAGPGLGLGAAAAAPPLVVGMIERLATADRSAVTGLRHWVAVVVAAGAGAFAAADITPRWTGGLIALAVVLVMFAAISGPHPPALAICLIPQAAGIHSPGSYVIDIAVGTAVLYLAASLINISRIPPDRETDDYQGNQSDGETGTRTRDTTIFSRVT